MVRVRSPQDFGAGILFIAFGVLALWLGRNYAIGTLNKMGPGFLPIALSFGLLGIGAILVLRALAIDGPAIETSELRPQLFVLAAIVVFAVTMERLGLALAVVAVTVTASLANRRIHWVETIALAIGLAVLCVVLFVTLLGQPFAIWTF